MLRNSVGQASGGETLFASAVREEGEDIAGKAFSVHCDYSDVYLNHIQVKVSLGNNCLQIVLIESSTADHGGTGYSYSENCYFVNVNRQFSCSNFSVMPLSLYLHRRAVVSDKKTKYSFCAKTMVLKLLRKTDT